MTFARFSEAARIVILETTSNAATAMRERSEKLVEIAKALGFVLVGLFGGFAAASFVDGFMDGWNDATRDSRGVEQRERTADPGDPD